MISIGRKNRIVVKMHKLFTHRASEPSSPHRDLPEEGEKGKARPEGTGKVLKHPFAGPATAYARLTVTRCYRSHEGVQPFMLWLKALKHLARFGSIY